MGSSDLRISKSCLLQHAGLFLKNSQKNSGVLHEHLPRNKAAKNT